MTEPDRLQAPRRSRRRLLLWLALFIWAPVALYIGDQWADTVRFRVNDFSVIPGAGSVQRNFEGVFYHVNTLGKARPIYPELAPPAYTQECYDCRLVSGEQLAQTNDFCATGVRSTLPAIEFQLPCATWATIDKGTQVMGFVVFILPLIGLAVLMWLARLAGRKRSKI